MKEELFKTETPSPSPKDGDAARGSIEAPKDMPMPGDAQPASAQDDALPPPPSFSKQMAQLVIIPAAITISCVIAMVVFAMLIGQPDHLEDQLLRLRQSSGSGKLAIGVQDPRYKDRWMAAANVAQMLSSVEEPAERQKLSNDLIDILDNNVEPHEDLLQLYLLMAVGQLGQPGGMQAIVERLNAPHESVRQGAIRGVLSWPDIEQAKAAVLPLAEALTDKSPVVRAEAAAALGALAEPGDEQIIEQLRQAMQGTGSEMREVQWNAAVSLAKLGDALGGQYVATVLLDRATLSKLPMAESGPLSNQQMAEDAQDRIILSTLASAAKIDAPQVWQKIDELAKQDASRSVRKAAQELLSAKQDGDAR